MRTTYAALFLLAALLGGCAGSNDGPTQGQIDDADADTDTDADSDAGAAYEIVATTPLDKSGVDIAADYFTVNGEKATCLDDDFDGTMCRFEVKSAGAYAVDAIVDDIEVINVVTTVSSPGSYDAALTKWGWAPNGTYFDQDDYDWQVVTSEVDGVVAMAITGWFDASVEADVLTGTWGHGTVSGQINPGADSLSATIGSDTYVLTR